MHMHTHMHTHRQEFPHSPLAVSTHRTHTNTRNTCTHGKQQDLEEKQSSKEWLITNSIALGVWLSVFVMNLYITLCIYNLLTAYKMSHGFANVLLAMSLTGLSVFITEPLIVIIKGDYYC